MADAEKKQGIDDRRRGGRLGLGFLGEIHKLLWRFKKFSDGL
jgi:hypothetical protein